MPLFGRGSTDRQDQAAISAFGMLVQGYSQQFVENSIALRFSDVTGGNFNQAIAWAVRSVRAAQIQNSLPIGRAASDNAIPRINETPESYQYVYAVRFSTYFDPAEETRFVQLDSNSRFDNASLAPLIATEADDSISSVTSPKLNGDSVDTSTISYELVGIFRS